MKFEYEDSKIKTVITLQEKQPKHKLVFTYRSDRQTIIDNISLVDADNNAPNEYLQKVNFGYDAGYNYYLTSTESTIDNKSCGEIRYQYNKKINDVIPDASDTTRILTNIIEPVTQNITKMTGISYKGELDSFAFYNVSGIVTKLKVDTVTETITYPNDNKTEELTTTYNYNELKAFTAPASTETIEVLIEERNENSVKIKEEKEKITQTNNIDEQTGRPTQETITDNKITDTNNNTKTIILSYSKKEPWEKQWYADLEGKEIRDIDDGSGKKYRYKNSYTYDDTTKTLKDIKIHTTDSTEENHVYTNNELRSQETRYYNPDFQDLPTSVDLNGQIQRIEYKPNSPQIDCTFIDLNNNGICDSTSEPKTTYSYNYDQSLTDDIPCGGYKITITDPIGNLSSTIHDWKGRPIKSWDEIKGKKVNLVEIEYDNLDRRIRSTIKDIVDGNEVATDRVVEYGYDIRDRQVSQTTYYTDYSDSNNPKLAAAITKILYDAFGRKKEVHDNRENIIERYTYNCLDHILKKYDSFNNPFASYIKGSLGKIKEETDKFGNTTFYEYYSCTDSPVGARLKLKSIIDDHNNKVTIEYDDLGNKKSEKKDALAGSACLATEYKYDLAGNLLWSKDPKGIRTFNFYDQAGRSRLVLKELNTNTSYQKDVALNSDAAINVTTFLSDTMQTKLGTSFDTFISDLNSRGLNAGIKCDCKILSITEYNSLGDTISSWDANFNKTSYKYYPENGRLKKITSPDQNWIRYVYDDLGNKRDIYSTSYPLAIGKELGSSSSSDTKRREKKSVEDTATLTKERTEYYVIKFTYYEGSEKNLPADFPKGVKLKETIIYPAAKGSTSDYSTVKSSYNYNDQGDIESITDENGQTTWNEYDITHRIKKRYLIVNNGEMRDLPLNARKTDINQDGKAYILLAEFEYNSLGDITKETDALGKSTTYDYDYLTVTINPFNNTSKRSNTWDSSKPGSPKYIYIKKSQTDAEGNETRFYYDKFGRIFKEGRVLVEGSRYSNLNFLGEEMNISETCFIKDDVLLYAENVYDDNGNITRTYTGKKIGGKRVNINYEYDEFNRRIKEYDPTTLDKTNHFLKETTYDGNGNRLEEKVYYDPDDYDPDDNSKCYTTQYTHDEMDRLIKTVYADGIIEEQHYNGTGERDWERRGKPEESEKSEETKESGDGSEDNRWKIIHYMYNPYGMLSKKVVILKKDSAYPGSDIKGKIIPNDCYLTEFQSPAPTGWLTGFSNKGLIIKEYAYITKDDLGKDGNEGGIGKPKWIRDANGLKTLYIYDEYNQQKEVYRELKEESQYKGLSYTICKKWDVDKAIKVGSFNYDLMGNKIEERKEIVDGKGVKTLLCTKYKYDVKGQLRNVYQLSKDGNNILISTINYDDLGNKIEEIDANNNHTYFSYDEFGRLEDQWKEFDSTSSYAQFNDSGKIFLVRNAYDGAGNKIFVQDADEKSTWYIYDERNNNTEIQRKIGNSWEKMISFTYDRLGNKRSEEDAGKDSVVYDYDCYGNVTEQRIKGAEFYEGAELKTEDLITSIFYDISGNRNKTIDPAGKITEYLYDELNKLVEVTYKGTGSGVNTCAEEEINNLLASIPADLDTIDETASRKRKEVVSQSPSLIVPDISTNPTIFNEGLSGDLSTSDYRYLSTVIKRKPDISYNQKYLLIVNVAGIRITDNTILDNTISKEIFNLVYYYSGTDDDYPTDVNSNITRLYYNLGEEVANAFVQDNPYGLNRDIANDLYSASRETVILTDINYIQTQEDIVYDEPVKFWNIRRTNIVLNLKPGENRLTYPVYPFSDVSETEVVTSILLKDVVKQLGGWEEVNRIEVIDPTTGQVKTASLKDPDDPGSLRTNFDYNSYMITPGTGLFVDMKNARSVVISGRSGTFYYDFNIASTEVKDSDTKPQRLVGTPFQYEKYPLHAFLNKFTPQQEGANGAESLSYLTDPLAHSYTTLFISQDGLLTGPSRDASTGESYLMTFNQPTSTDSSYKINTEVGNYSGDDKERFDEFSKRLNPQIRFKSDHPSSSQKLSLNLNLNDPEELNITQYIYDGNGNLIWILDAAYDYDNGDMSKGHCVENSFDEFDNKIMTIQRHSLYYNEDGVLKTDDAQELITRWGYDLAHNIVWEIDPNHSLTNDKFTYTYDEYNRKQRVDFPDPIDKVDMSEQDIYPYNEFTVYKYDQNGNLTRVCERKYKYDSSGVKIYSSGRKDRLCRCSEATLVTEMKYDEFDREMTNITPEVSGTTYTENKLEYTYFPGGSRKTLTEYISYPGGLTTAYTYNDLHQLEKVYTDELIYDDKGEVKGVTRNSEIATYSYYDNGLQEELVYGNDTRIKHDYYKGTKQVKSINNLFKDGSIISRFEYKYNSEGNRTKQTETRRVKRSNEKGSEYPFEFDSSNLLTFMTTYTYDGMDRLKEVFYHYDTDNTLTSEEEKETYYFDEVGNRLARMRSFGDSSIKEVTLYRYNGVNQLIESVDIPGDDLMQNVKGDINGDGAITPQDALIIFQVYIGKESCPSGSDCDVNGDGDISPADALCLFQKYLEQPNCLDTVDDAGSNQ
ncbi:MAG: dockerin type I domain-containing protein [bacterium]